MKKLLFKLFLILFLSETKSYGQTLTNTTWIMYNKSAFVQYVSFKIDSVYFSYNNQSYTVASTYTTSAGNFTITDLFGSCSSAGVYSFIIQNDTLKFTLINDLCFPRVDALTNLHWVRYYGAAGIANRHTGASFLLYPNPCKGTLKILIPGSTSIAISNLQGQVVREIKTDNGEIAIEGMSPGIYMVKILNSEQRLLVHEKMVFE